MKEKLLVLISGSSGSGKNTLINLLIKKNSNIKFLVSHTTREKRGYEIEGEVYNFIEKEEFELAIANNQMLEYDVTHRGYYGISKATIFDMVSKYDVIIKDISVKGVVNCRQELSGKVKVVSIFLTESKKVLKDRLIKRGEKNHKLRLKIYKHEQSLSYVNDYIIKNNNIEKSINKIECIIKNAQNNDELTALKKKRISNRKLKRYEKILSKTTKLKPIKVVNIDNNIYIVDKIEKHLSALKLNKVWSKKFVDPTKYIK